MKKSALLLLSILFLLPSCVVTRARYGNGIHVDMPQLFGKKEKSSSESKLSKKRKIVLTPSVKLDEASNDSTSDSKLTASIQKIDCSNISDSKELVTSKRLRNNGQISKPKHKSYSSILLTKKSEAKSNTSNNKSHSKTKVTGDNDMFEIFGAIILALLIGMAVYVLVIGLLILLLPPAIMEMVFTICGIIALILCLL